MKIFTFKNDDALLSLKQLFLSQQPGPEAIHFFYAQLN